MPARPTRLLALLVMLIGATAARADFIYRYTTTTTAGAGGTLMITIDAPDSAIKSGFLTNSNISSLTLRLTSTGSPFSSFTDTHVTDLVMAAQVNTTTGAIVHNGDIDAMIFPPLEVVLVPLLLGSTPYHVMAPNSTLGGAGTWALETVPTVVPEPSSIMLAGMAGVVFVFGRARARFRRA